MKPYWNSFDCQVQSDELPERDTFDAMMECQEEIEALS